MYIKSINLRNLYTFGDSGTPELKDFNQFNLFIGKNGSGKSNAIRAFCKSNVQPIDHNGHVIGGFINRTSKRSSYVNSDPNKEKIELTIQYENGDTVFVNQTHSIGNVESQRAEYILGGNSNKDLNHKLEELSDNRRNIICLSFSLSYIFQHTFSIINGDIYENFTKQNSESGNIGKPILLEQWSSGFFSVTNLLIKLLTSSKDIICIDEPETHLEPRVIRRLMNVIIWISQISTEKFDCEINEMNKSWKSWLIKRYGEERPSWIEEKNNTPKQIFIASHSSVLMNQFLSKKIFVLFMNLIVITKTQVIHINQMVLK